MCANAPWRSEEGAGSPGTEVIVSHKPPNVAAGNGSMEEKQAILTLELSLALLIYTRGQKFLSYVCNNFP